MTKNKDEIFVHHADKNIKPKDYEQVCDENQLLVTNVFPTLQGEGPFSGSRSVFVRLAGCNYGGKGVNGPGCTWCDSDFRFKNGHVTSFQELERYIDETKQGHVQNGNQYWKDLIVVTGGEPLLQKNLGSFLSYYQENHPTTLVQIESNGIYFPENLPDFVFLVLSPKAPEKVLEGGKFIKGKYAKLSKSMMERADCLKVLVSADENSPYYDIPDFAYDFAASGKEVYLSPINVYHSTPEVGTESIFDPNIFDIEAIQRNHSRAANLCMETGFKLNVQQHLFCALP